MRPTIAEQVKNHLAYGKITFEDSCIADTSVFSHWRGDDDGYHAVFIDGSSLKIEPDPQY